MDSFIQLILITCVFLENYPFLQVASNLFAQKFPYNNFHSYFTWSFPHTPFHTLVFSFFPIPWIKQPVVLSISLPPFPDPPQKQKAKISFRLFLLFFKLVDFFLHYFLIFLLLLEPQNM